MATQTKSSFAVHETDQPVDWDTVYTLELPRVYNFFLYKIGDKDVAQDLTAITFERAWTLRSRYRTRLGLPSTWLFGIARNVVKEHLRKSGKVKQRLARFFDNDQASTNADVEQRVQQQQDKDRLRSIISELPQREQDLIAMKCGAGLTNREIARISKLSESNVGSILYRSVRKLRSRWDENDE